MRVEIHNNLKDAISVQASRVVVYDNFDNPIALAISMDGNQLIVSTVTQKSFASLLKALGINKTVVVDTLDTTKLKPLV